MDTPAPPLLLVIVLWMIGLGVWIEKRRHGGTHDLEHQVHQLTAENARLRAELRERRQSAMARHPSAFIGPDADLNRLHVVPGGRA